MQRVVEIRALQRELRVDASAFVLWNPAHRQTGIPDESRKQRYAHDVIDESDAHV